MRSRSGRFSESRGPPAVDDQRLSGDEIALRRREEYARADQIIRLLQTLQRPPRKLCRRAAVAPVGTRLYVLGHRRTGSNCVDANTVIPKLIRHGACHSEHCALGSIVMHIIRQTCEDTAGRDINDLAVSLLAHHRNCRLRAQKRAADIDLHHPVKQFRRDLIDGRAFQVSKNRRIIDEHIDPAPAGLRQIHQ